MEKLNSGKQRNANQTKIIKKKRRRKSEVEREARFVRAPSEAEDGNSRETFTGYVEVEALRETIATLDPHRAVEEYKRVDQAIQSLNECQLYLAARINEQMAALTEHYSRKEGKQLRRNAVLELCGIGQQKFSRLLRAYRVLKSQGLLNVVNGEVILSRLMNLIPYLDSGVLTKKRFEKHFQPMVMMGSHTRTLEFDKEVATLKVKANEVHDEETGESTVPMNFAVCPLAAELFESMRLTMIEQGVAHDRRSAIEQMLLVYGSIYSSANAQVARTTQMAETLRGMEKAFSTYVMVVDNQDPDVAQEELQGIRVYEKPSGDLICAQSLRAASRFTKCDERDLQVVECDFSPLVGAFIGRVDNMFERKQGNATKTK